MSFWNEKIKFKNLEVPRFMAAPLDGVTDSPMRQLIRKFSPDVLLFSEMRHVACVANEKRQQSVKYKKMEKPLAFQFSANTTKFIDVAVEKVLEKGIEMFNLNLGCPARNVVNSGSGSALMAKPDELKVIIKHFKKVIPDNIPFTIKIRSGFKDINALEISEMAEGLGVDGIIIHPRTQPQGFTGLPDAKLVKVVKDKIKIPIIFSGNINSFARAKKIYDQTGVDGFMIGRAVWGCPWKIKEITDAVENKQFSITVSEAIGYAIKHLDLNMEHYGLMGYNGFKKQLPVYIKSIDNASFFRGKLLSSKSAEEMFFGLNEILENAKKA